MSRKYTTKGPPKSGKTKRLIERANKEHELGMKVKFITHEDSPTVLRERGLVPGVAIEIGDEEAVVVG